MFQAGRHADVETHARRLLTKHPQSGFLWKALGAAQQIQGKDALHALKQSCTLLHGDAESHNILGVALHAAGQSGAALNSLDNALRLKPDYADACSNRGMMLFDLARYQEAMASLERALALNPLHVQACNNLGNVYLKLKLAGRAAECYRRAIALVPQYAEAHNNLGNALHALGNLEEAAASYRQAVRHRPDYAEALSNLASVQQELGLLDKAQDNCRRALTLDPHCAKAHANLARVLQERGEIDAALGSFARALELAPAMPEALSNLGNALRELGRLDEAEAYCRRAIAVQPNFTEAHVNLGLVQRQQGLTAAAQESCRTALEIEPGLVGAIEFDADLSADCGRFAEAEAGYCRALSLAPQSVQSWAGIARVRKMGPDDTAWRTSVEALLAQGMAPRKETTLRYALGKYWDDLGEYDAAFGHYRRANELSRSYTRPYLPDREAARIDALTRTYDAAWFGREHAGALSSTRPVFIIGMPRSGTSLAEQIIASHPDAYGAGELPFWTAAAPGFDASSADAGSRLTDLARRYLASLEGFPGDAQYVADKMPGNFNCLGLIHAALPNARFIHMRRNPVDTCLSIYFQHFNTDHTYANDLSHLAHYYAGYLRLMSHWRAVLPAHAMLEVPYEELVSGQESWSRRMIEFIGLPWDSRCLDFHESRRAVGTASNWQVRQKMHTASVARWRRYEAWVAPLMHLL
jgi:tetratricopeptide (TPR) repeat protein